MKKLLLVLLLSVIIYGCNKNDNPVTSTTQEPTWSLIYSRADSVLYLDTTYLQKIAYVRAESTSKCWVKFNYKSNGYFKFDTKMRNGQYVNTMNGSSLDWKEINDSSLFNYANYDTLYYNITPSHTHNVTLKNLEVYIK